jgi:uncharacterized Ntn-hydrolase superfamily protein
MTFSIAARCAVTGRFAIAVASSSPAVAARCAHARAGVGAVATQNITDPRLGPRGLDLMAAGASADEALAQLRETAPDIDYRQLALVDGQGRGAGFSGAKCLGVHATAVGRDVVSAGNLLSHEAVPASIIAAFEDTAGQDLGDRIIHAMQAGLDAGGEAGPIRSAGLIMVDKVSWAVADLRVDWHDHPIAELTALWRRWQPQAADYVTRALNPGGAPSYGVPGDL